MIGRTLSRSGRDRFKPLLIACLAGLVGLLYVAYLRQSRSLGTDADGASNVLQAWDMLHGNPLLRGWWLSDVSFYPTELPEYMLAELVRGMNAGVINAAGAATFTLLLVLAGVLAKGRATGTAGMIRVLIAVGIMFAPGPAVSAGTLLSTPDHVGTQVPLLLVWLAIDRIADRWYLPILVGLLLTWVEIADQMAVYVGAMPVIVISVIRLYQRRPTWRVDAGLAVTAALTVAAAATALQLIRQLGGFVVAPTTAVFAPSSQLPHNAALAAESVLALFGADFFGLRFGLPVAVALMHLAGVILVAWACCIAVRRLFSASDRLVPILVVGVAIDLGAYLFSTQAIDLGSTHELAAVLPFGAVLAGRLISDQPVTKSLLPVLLALLAGYSGVLAYYATRPAKPPTTQAVASWLTAHHLTAGIGGYWTANITTVATSGRVQVRPVTMSCGRFVPDAWESKKLWYQLPGTATFLVQPIGPRIGAGNSAAAAQFGRPQRTVRFGNYQIMTWKHNLMPALTSGFHPGCGPGWQR